MSIDTRAKRASSIGMARPWMVQLPVPDASITSAEDRQQVAYRYVGILSGPVVAPGLINYIMTVTEVSQPVMEIL